MTRARSAQANFERRRRLLLPITFSSGGRCEERIGRFCYWYDEGDTTLPAEPPAVRVARGHLLAELDSLHASIPGDDWVVGQRVRYLVEHANAATAAQLTASCVPDRWWCWALQGYALHALGRFSGANAAFDRALVAMPDQIRCEWTDWTDLLDGDLHHRFRNQDCISRAAFADTILWLGTPLLSREGNDLRTELLSRRVIDWQLRTSRSPQAMPWGRDVTELILRYGWPVRWSTAAPSHPAALEPASVVGHEPTPAFSFLPLRSEGSASWRFDLHRRRPRARYAPDYARRIEPIEHLQIARFPREDSTVLVLTADLRADPAFDRPFDLAAAASTGPGTQILTAHRAAAGGAGVVTLRAPGVPILVGIEAEAQDGRFARSRHWVEPVATEAGFRLSDLLLFRAEESLPGSLADAAGRALPSARWSRTQPVGVYWELTGPGADTVEVAVSVVPERRGLLGRIGQSLALVKRRAPLTLEWEVGADPGSASGRAFELNLTELRPGEYTLVLTVVTADGVERTSQRRVNLLH